MDLSSGSGGDVGATLADAVHWIDARQAAVILGVTPTRVWQLTRRGLLLYVRLSTRRIRYRRQQIEVIANARDTRYGAHRAQSQARYKT